MSPPYVYLKTWVLPFVKPRRLNIMDNRNVSTFQAYFQRLVKSVRNPSSLVGEASNTSPTTVLQRVRNVNQAQLVSGGVIVAELLGFFTVGEMIGRWKLVGYKGDTGAHH